MDPIQPQFILEHRLCLNGSPLPFETRKMDFDDLHQLAGGDQEDQEFRGKHHDAHAARRLGVLDVARGPRRRPAWAPALPTLQEGREPRPYGPRDGRWPIRMTDLFPQRRSKARPRRPTWPKNDPEVGKALFLEEVGHRVPLDNKNPEQTLIATNLDSNGEPLEGPDSEGLP
jgi:hypothetical protein